MFEFLPQERRFLGLEDAWAGPEEAGCVFVPAPYEASSSYRRGSAHGPEALLAASRQVELFDAALGRESFRDCRGIATVAPLETATGAEAFCTKLSDTVTALRARGKFVVTLGGEHSAVVGAVRAHTAADPELTVLQLDAHSDLRESYEDEAWSHACAMARVRDTHPRLVQAGIRSQCAEERAVTDAQGIPVFYGEDIQRRAARGEDWVAPILEMLSQRVYVTFDCDVMDPSVVPGTGTPEPGGLTWTQANTLFERLCAERELVGFDISELAPLPDAVHSEFTIAKLAYRVLGYRFGNTART